MKLITMDWKQLYSGTIQRSDIKKYIPEEKWQQLRLSLKGQTLETKYKKLLEWLELNNYSFSSKIQVTNYVTALSRGGLIKPEDYR